MRRSSLPPLTNRRAKKTHGPQDSAATPRYTATLELMSW